MNETQPSAAQLERVRVLAQRASLGRWGHSRGVLPTLHNVDTGEELGELYSRLALENARYIAAMNPMVALMMIAELTELREQLAVYKELLDDATEGGTTKEGDRVQYGIRHTATSVELCGSLAEALTECPPGGEIVQRNVTAWEKMERNND